MLACTACSQAIGYVRLRDEYVAQRQVHDCLWPELSEVCRLALSNDVRVKVNPLHASEKQMGGEGIDPTHLSQEGGGCSAPCSGRLTLGKYSVPFVHEDGFASWLVWMLTENIIPAEFDPRTVQHAASRYTDWAIPATINDVAGINPSQNMHYKLRIFRSAKLLQTYSRRVP
jgi:hypothetical protein